MSSRPSSKHRCRRRAFTLPEAIGALVILAITVPAVFGAARESAGRRINPMLQTRASWLAVERLEDVIADRFSPMRGYEYLDPGNYPDESPVVDAPAFSRTVDLQECGMDLAPGGEGCMIVGVTVSWTDSTGQPQDVTIRTVLTHFEP